jgi:electron transport complex protein RnfD
MKEQLIVTASPHIRDSSTTRGLMGNVLVALIPCVVASALIFGYHALLVVGVTLGASVGFEALYSVLMHKPNPVGDLSACVTGVILGLNFPAGIPLWICVVGAFVAIVITKQLFGGLGFNFANPALVGRIVLFLGFPARMTAYVFPDLAVDALASATPLASSVDKSTVSLLDLFLGIHGGMLGEVCILAILLGLAYLLVSRTIHIAIPASIVITVFLCSLIATRDFHSALAAVMSGGLLFGAVFMATDYVTSPFTTKGKLIYGVVIGLICFAIRHFGNMNEGMSYAILMGNLLTPWFNAWSHQVPLGYVKPRKKTAKAAHAKGGAQ